IHTQESDLITSEQGRQLASEIGAFYYESSVVTRYGVDNVFDNAVRMALIGRRQQRFWVKSLKNVTTPILFSCTFFNFSIHFEGTLPSSKTEGAGNKVLPSTFENDMYSLLDKEYSSDVTLTIGEHEFHVHKIILSCISSLFKRIFISSSEEKNSAASLAAFEGLSPFSVQCFLSNDILEDFKRATNIAENEVIKALVINIENNNSDQKHVIRDIFYKQFMFHLSDCLQKQLFVDVRFKLEDGISYAHRSVLMARCAVMAAMFGGDFRESRAEIIPFPGVTKETFDAFLHYVYTDSVDENIKLENCLPLIELANRLWLPRFISAIELHVIQTSAMKAKGINKHEQVCKLLEPCQVHNAFQLAEWCQYYIIINFQDISINSPKLLRSLHQDNQAHLNKNRWPPAQCVREQEVYEKPQKCVMWKSAKKKVSGCLCPKPKANASENQNSATKTRSSTA
ncbi:rho-related BTB domain-containing protein 1, partial [Caerostris extrusa]